jgi:hypothetical protein
VNRFVRDPWDIFVMMKKKKTQIDSCLRDTGGNIQRVRKSNSSVPKAPFGLTF